MSVVSYCRQSLDNPSNGESAIFGPRFATRSQKSSETVRKTRHPAQNFRDSHHNRTSVPTTAPLPPAAPPVRASVATASFAQRARHLPRRRFGVPLGGDCSGFWSAQGQPTIGVQPHSRYLSALVQDPAEQRSSLHKPAMTLEDLPAPWIASVDPATGRTFYYNTQTAVSVWDHPAVASVPMPSATDPSPTSTSMFRVCLASPKRKIITFSVVSALLVAGVAAYLISSSQASTSKPSPSWTPLSTSTGDVSVDPTSYAVDDDAISAEQLLKSVAVALQDQGASSSISEGASSSILASDSAEAQAGDSQYFVQFSSDAGDDTLKAFAAFTGRPVLQYIGDRAFLALGDALWANVSRTYPGVVFVQLRDAASKRCPQLTAQLAVGPVTQALVAQCFSPSSCSSAAGLVDTSKCSVAVHEGFVEASCEPSAVAAQVDALVLSPNVHFVELKPDLKKSNFAGKSIVGTGPQGASPAQSAAISRVPMDDSVVAVADTGVDQSSCFFSGGNRVVHTYWFQGPELCSECGGCSRNGIPSIGCGNSVDEDGHGTHVAGTVAGASSRGASHASSRFDGIAAGSKIFFQDIMNEVPDARCPRGAGGCVGGLYPPSNLQNLFAPAYAAGARVHSNSWGGSGNGYGSMPKAIDQFAYTNPDFLVVFAAGNAGGSSPDANVGQPATCKNCLSVGASDLRSDQLLDQSQYLYPKPSTPSGRSSDNLAAFSSVGPSNDGRFKPDVVAPGVDTVSAHGPGRLADFTMVPTSPDHCEVGPNAYTAADAAVQRMSGTSMAAPLAAGAAEKVRQYFVKGFYPSGAAVAADSRAPSASTVRAVLIGGAQPLAGKFPTLYPNVYTGFGLINLDASLFFNGVAGSRRVAVTESSVSSTQNARAYSFQCSSSASTSISLVWADAAGSSTARKQLVNDLDLIVQLADGTHRFGNNQGFADSLNNAEKIVLPSCSGTVTIIVRADTLVTISQAFSVVVQGAVVPPLADAALPSVFDTGRPKYLDRSSTADPTIDCTTATNNLVVNVPFKSGMAWTSTNAAVNGRVFTSGLAMLFGVGISALGYTYTTGDLVIKCDVFIGPGFGLRYRSNTITRSNLYAAISDKSSPLYSSSAFSSHNWAAVALPGLVIPPATTAPPTTAAPGPTAAPSTTSPPRTTAPAPPPTTQPPGSCPANCKSRKGLTVTGSNNRGCPRCTYLDINECASASTHDCDTVNGICANYVGSFACMCKARAGYSTGSGQGTKSRPCVYTDINECSRQSVGLYCHVQSGAQCSNSVGSYSCSCPPRAGFRVSGTGQKNSPCVYTRV